MRNKVLLYLLFFMAFLFSANAQNLVPNYSFEEYSQCAVNWDCFNGYVLDWTGQNGAGPPGWFTSLCPDSSNKNQSAGVPYNGLGFQYAHTGNSYAQIQNFTNGGGDTSYPYKGNALKDLRNYIQVGLTDSLLAGHKYYVAFFASLADSSVYACNDIGAYFSDSLINYSSVGSVLSYHTPQVANNPIKNPLTDTMSWSKILGNFIAQGGEKYIVIGNFKNDSLSSTKYLGKRSVNATAAYYYIDDIIVSPDSNYADSVFASVQTIANPSESVSVFPNPSNGKFNFDISNYVQGIRNRIEIYNVLGEQVSQIIINNSTFTITLTNEPSGIYLYRIVSDNGNFVATGKLIIQ